MERLGRRTRFEPMSEEERKRRLKKCRRCYWWDEKKFFCRLNWLIHKRGKWSYKRMCCYDPNMWDRFTPKEKEE